VPTLIGAVTILFFLMRVMPGDIALLILAEEGGTVDPVQYETIREQMGLNRPLYEQYFSYLWQLARFDLGTSLWTAETVWSEIMVRMPYTMSLVFLTVAVSIMVAIPIGVLSAIHQDSWLDYGLRSLAISGLSIPNFWFCMLLLLILVKAFRWFPPLDYAPIYREPLVALQQLILPALALGYRAASVSARMMRSSMLEVLREDYVRTARAKGLKERIVIYLHALRNAVLPVVTIFGMEFVMLFSGAVIVETIFNIPGIGSLLLDGITNRDLPLVQGVVTFIIVIVLVGNLAVDLIYAWIDPRIRFR